jgi:hypothetical protein
VSFTSTVWSCCPDESPTAVAAESMKGKERWFGVEIERVGRGGGMAGVERKKGMYWEEAGIDVESLHWVEWCVGGGEWHKAMY